MNSDCNWQLVNKLLADQKLINGRICDNTFKIQKDNLFLRVTRKKEAVPDIVDVDGSVEGQGDHLRHLPHLQIT